MGPFRVIPDTSKSWSRFIEALLLSSPIFYLSIMHNRIAENVFGTIGTICWTAQLIPQVWKSSRSKSTAGLSHWLVFLWGISAAFQGLYALLQKLNIPLMVQPQIFGFLSFISWGQCQYYGLKRSLRASVTLTAFTIALFGVLELVLVLAIRPSHNRGNHTAASFFGILGSVLVSVALFPQYWEIYKYKEVIGISTLFIWVDIMGGVFNLLSLAFKEEFDAIAAVTYSLVVLLDGVIVVAAMISNPIAHKRRQREAQARNMSKNQASPSGQSRPSYEERGHSSYATFVYEFDEDRRRYGDKSGDNTHNGVLPLYTEKDETHDGYMQGSHDAGYRDHPPDYEGSPPRSTSIPLPPPVILHQP